MYLWGKPLLRDPPAFRLPTYPSILFCLTRAGPCCPPSGLCLQAKLRLDLCRPIPCRVMHYAPGFPIRIVATL